MPRKRWIDKSSAQKFSLLYRPQNDPALHDEAAGERALYQISGPASKLTSGHVPSSSSSQVSGKSLHLADLEDDLDFESMRENEGEAAEHGVFFDDTKYDYMQHLREFGEGGELRLVEDPETKSKEKGKGKMKLEDMLRDMNMDEGQSVTGSEMISNFSATTRQRTYQDQQDVPDEIAGFQPDMDPRLREVLEALDDDAYVDDQDENDIFGALAKDGRNGELELDEFEANFIDDDEGWESDATERAPEQPSEVKMPANIPAANSVDGLPAPDAEAAAAEDGDWLRDFAKFKRDGAARKMPPRPAESIIAASATQDQAPSLYTLNGTPLRQKKRKGALTNPSSYSMTSSSLARTSGQQLLDARFDQIEKMYSVDEGDEFDDMDGGMSLASGMTGASKMSKMSQLSTTSFADQGAVRGDFGGMMDDFLGDWNKANPGGGKRKGAKGKRGKNGNEKFGLEQLEEVRRELGPARIQRPTKA
jgi:protein LTV1